MPARLTNETATARLLEFGYEALESYPGSISAPWRARHTDCGQEVTLTWMKAANKNSLIECPCLPAIQAARLVRRTATMLNRKAVEAVEEMKAASWKPLEAYPGLSGRWRCLCLICGVESSVMLGTVRAARARSQNKKNSCQSCTKKASDREAELRSLVVLAEAGMEPLEPYPGSRLAPWRIRYTECGHEAAPVYVEIQQGNARCMKCSRIATGAKKLRVKAEAAVQVMRENSLEPLVPYPGSDVNWRCRCTRCGNLTSPRHKDLKRGASMGCTVCKTRSQAATRKASNAEIAEAKMRAAGYTLLEPYPGAGEKWSVRCSCGKDTSPTYTSVTSMGVRGCKDCAEYGFQRSKPAVVYLVTNARLGAIKVGVAGAESSRLAGHARHGWEAVVVEAFEEGAPAWAIEREILNWWRKDMGLPPYLSAEDMPIGGATETAELDVMPAWLAIERVRAAAARERELAASA